jgi:hypothetical protein
LQSQSPSLPGDVQRKIERENELERTIFSVQQLLLVLENAKLMATQPTINLPTNERANSMFLQKFLGTYLRQMQEKGEPLLGLVIQERISTKMLAPTLKLSDFQYHISPYVDAQGQSVKTLTDMESRAVPFDFLRISWGNTLPSAVPFTWN